MAGDEVVPGHRRVGRDVDLDDLVLGGGEGRLGDPYVGGAQFAGAGPPVGDAGRLGEGLEAVAVELQGAVHRAVVDELAGVEVEGAGAQRGHRGHLMADVEDGPTVLGHIAHLRQGLVLELGVADREHLVDGQDLGLQVCRDGEGEAYVHAGGIALDRGVEELGHSGELDDVVEAPTDLLASHAEQGAVEVDVLPTGELGVEAGADLEQAAHPAAQLDPPGGRGGDPGEDLQQSRLAGAVAADDPDGLTERHREIDVGQRLEDLVLLATERMPEAFDDGFGGPGGAVTGSADAIGLGQAGNRDRCGRVHSSPTETGRPLHSPEP
ncbi:hypothetical protein SDC9_84622 [bioreactor metagenome]|uniref:Uncharacterized protein n=1 Tax=bioreactor metagenome TaxID=1076179 RepID=A0A644ZBA4_9ZZZZ